MGLCESAEVVEALNISRQIDKEILAGAKRFNQRSLLLLGAAESGKSTCVKQMQILHNNGFTNSELESRKYIIYSNTVRGMMELVQAMLFSLGLDFEDPSLRNDFELLRAFVESGREFSAPTCAVVLAIQRLWGDESVRQAYERRAEFHIHDNAAHFFESIDRIAQHAYQPTNEDVLLTRFPTTGVYKIGFSYKNVEFTVFDVGGQRSERRKWIHFFEDVDAIIFVAAISEYDQKLREDNKTNRLLEAFTIFESITSAVYFSSTSTILFLNKKDLFRAKIKEISLSVLFEEYDGGLSYSRAVAFLRKKFQGLYKSDKNLYIHETFATDTRQIDTVFNSVLGNIVRGNMENAGIY